MTFLRHALFILILLGCSSDPAPLDYCLMIEADQSFVNNDRSNLAQFEADRAKREALIEANFDGLLEVVNRSGFPILTDKDKEENTCRYRAITMTMIHTAQLFPERFFGPFCTAIFTTEMKEDRLDQALLERASIITARTMDICTDWKPQIQQALFQWGLDLALLEEMSFVECE